MAQGTSQPMVTLTDETAAVAAAMGVTAVHLSTALTKALAVAVMVEGNRD